MVYCTIYRQCRSNVITSKNNKNVSVVKRSISKEKIFIGIAFLKLLFLLAGAFVLLIMVLIFGQLLSDSWLIWEKEGLSFVTGDRWNPVEGREAFGALPYIAGTLVTSLIALCIAVPLSLGIAMFLSEIAPTRIREPISFIVELLACSSKYHLWIMGFVYIPDSFQRLV